MDKLKKEQLNCEIFSVYDYDGLSLQELLCQFFMKINECVDTSNKMLDLSEWLVNKGLAQEVAIKLDKWLKDGTLEDVINTNLFATLDNRINELGINVKSFGCVGDGLTDDTLNFKKCLEYCRDNKKQMYIPRGTYIINNTIFSSNNISSADALKPIVIKGEGANLVKLNTTNDTAPVLNLSTSKIVIIEDVGSDNSWVQPVQYGEVFEKWNKDRTLFVKNVLAFSRENGYHGYNLLINAPRPSTYEHNPHDSNFFRYPLSIQNFSGYNAINIENMALNENGEITSNADGCALGIMEKANSSVGSILQDMTISNRPAHQILSSNEGVIKSSIRNNPCYEVDYNGHLSIGCSTQSNDTVAKGSGTIKLRDNTPMIRFYNATENNKEYRIQCEENTLKFVVDGSVPLELGSETIKLSKINGQVKINGFDASKGILWQNEEEENRQLYIDENGYIRLTYYEWCNNGDGDHIQTSRSGSSNERPTLRNHNQHDTGYMYFDTDLNKPIWWCGNVWKDANGVNV